jgi:hypothetical protein
MRLAATIAGSGYRETQCSSRSAVPSHVARQLPQSSAGRIEVSCVGFARIEPRNRLQQERASHSGSTGRDSSGRSTRAIADAATRRPGQRLAPGPWEWCYVSAGGDNRATPLIAVARQLTRANGVLGPEMDRVHFTRSSDDCSRLSRPPRGQPPPWRERSTSRSRPAACIAERRASSDVEASSSTDVGWAPAPSAGCES